MPPVLLVLTYGFDLDTVRQERQPIVHGLNRAEPDEDTSQSLCGHVAEAEQVDVLRGPDWLTEPHQEQGGPFENELVGELRHGQAV